MRCLALQERAPNRQTLWPLSLSRQRLPLYLLQSLLVSRDDRCAVRRLCRRVRDWQQFFFHAETHGVAVLLHRVLGESGFELPREEASALARRTAVGELVLRHQHQGLSLVLTAFEKAGLLPVVLKGPVLAERLYG